MNDLLDHPGGAPVGVTQPGFETYAAQAGPETAYLTDSPLDFYATGAVPVDHIPVGSTVYGLIVGA